MSGMRSPFRSRLKKSSTRAKFDVTVVSRPSVRAPKTATLRITGEILNSLQRETLSTRAKKKLKAASSVTIAFVEKSEIRKLNRRYRGKNKPTDILSFESIEEGSLGELVIALDVIRAQAREHELSLEQELTYMLIHGVLHLLGYDHEVSPSGARQMFSIQDRIFEKLR